jgi:hypothetical protein
MVMPVDDGSAAWHATIRLEPPPRTCRAGSEFAREGNVLQHHPPVKRGKTLPLPPREKHSIDHELEAHFGGKIDRDPRYRCRPLAPCTAASRDPIA